MYVALRDRAMEREMVANGGNSRIILQIMSMIHDSSIIQQNKLPSKDHLLAFHNPHFVP